MVKTKVSPKTLDIISPLPPTRSGIADYVADILPYLAQRFQIRLWQLPGQEISQELKERYEVIPWNLFGRIDTDYILYQMGNNEYHTAVYKAALKKPGILVLHDYCLHHFILQRTVIRDKFTKYQYLMSKMYGIIGKAVAQPRKYNIFGDSAHFLFSLNREIVKKQKAIVFHNSWAKNKLKEEWGVEFPAHVIPMAIPLPTIPEREKIEKFKQDLFIEKNIFLLGVFGFQTPIKRTHLIIKALEKLPENIHLMVVGQLIDIYPLKEYAKKYGVEKRVHFLGYLPKDKINIAIGAIDLPFSLRYPTAGETSASLLRILALGKPAVVTNYGPLSEIQQEIRFDIPYGDEEKEIEAIVEVTKKAQKTDIAKMGKKAREYIQKIHSPEKVVEKLSEIIEKSKLEKKIYVFKKYLPTTLCWRENQIEIKINKPEKWTKGERKEVRIDFYNKGNSILLAGSTGKGGVSAEIKILSCDETLQDFGWIPLPRTLYPNEQISIPLQIRKPFKKSILSVKAKILYTEELFTIQCGEAEITL